jgi:hypothetical protein
MFPIFLTRIRRIRNKKTDPAKSSGSFRIRIRTHNTPKIWTHCLLNMSFYYLFIILIRTAKHPSRQTFSELVTYHFS